MQHQFKDSGAKAIILLTDLLPKFNEVKEHTDIQLVITTSGNLNILIPNPRDMDAFVQAIKPFKFTGFAGINTLFVGLCMHPEFKVLDFSALKITISGGTALTSTAKAITLDGFFKTGDVGICLEDGTIKIVDRLKVMIIVSGFNVYPNEIEDVLSQHDAILEAAVIGEPDEKTGEKVCAYITVKSEVSESDILAHYKVMLTAYKVPKKIVFMQELPKSSVGKLLRRELRK
jgi:acyl-CoA synthetase (AMP-forming)/AMP-acid ligase II